MEPQEIATRIRDVARGYLHSEDEVREQIGFALEDLADAFAVNA